MAENEVKVAKQPNASALQWSKRQQIKANYELDKWKEEFDYEADYNSPVRQLERLYEANINPLFGGSEFSDLISHGDASIGSTGDGGNILGSLVNAGKGIMEFFRGKKDQLLKERALENDEKNTDIKAKESEATIQRLQKQNDLSDAQIKELNESVAYIQANTKRTQESIDNQVKELQIMQAQLDELKRHNQAAEQNDAYQSQTNRISAVAYTQSVKNQRDALDRQLNIDEAAVQNRAQELTLKFNEMSAKQIQDYIESKKLTIAGVNIDAMKYRFKSSDEKLADLSTHIALSQALANTLQNRPVGDASIPDLTKMYNQVASSVNSMLQSYKLQMGTQVLKDSRPGVSFSDSSTNPNWYENGN